MTTTDEDHIARRLKDRRQTLRLSIEKLAQRSGVSRAMISKVERRQSNPMTEHRFAAIWSCWTRPLERRR
jgi:transcriptional regulator with XRE-family HTH domain